jgi:hypothetical protein
MDEAVGAEALDSPQHGGTGQSLGSGLLDDPFVEGDPAMLVGLPDDYPQQLSGLFEYGHVSPLLMFNA